MDLLATDLRRQDVTRYLERLRRMDTGCLEWTGGLNSDGYGIMRVGERSIGRRVLVHRMAVAIALARCPWDRMVDHTCSNRRCCEPTHLRLVTHEQNTPGIFGLPPYEPIEDDENDIPF